jgi:hypothetical protein
MKLVKGRGLFNHSLSKSLKKIRTAKTRFHSLTSSCSSDHDALVSQIKLCEVLLEEIQSISYSLEKRTGKRSSTRRRSAATRRNRSNPYRPVPQRDAPDRSKQRK